MRQTELRNSPIFVDLDGVLADFNARVLELLGKTSDEIPDAYMWPRLADYIIRPNGHRHLLLRTMSRNPNGTTIPDLGFIKAQGTKQLNTLTKRKFVELRGFKYYLSPKGANALAVLDRGEDYREGPDFFNSLDKMPGADLLWNAVKKRNPVILTGKPHGYWADPQKTSWVRRELSPTVPLIICKSSEKSEEAEKYMGTSTLEGAILIDDKEKNGMNWLAHGGRFNLHTSAENSVAQLLSMLGE
jgi:hypothetical protein